MCEFDDKFVQSGIRLFHGMKPTPPLFPNFFITSLSPGWDFWKISGNSSLWKGSIMDQQARLKATVDIVYRNAPARLKMQLLNRGKTLTPAEQEAAAGIRRGTPGPNSMARIPQNSRRK